MAGLPQTIVGSIVNVKWGDSSGAILVGGPSGDSHDHGPSAIKFDEDGSELVSFPLADWSSHDEEHFPGFPDIPVDTTAICGLPNGMTAVGYNEITSLDEFEPNPTANESDALIVYGSGGGRVWSALSYYEFESTSSSHVTGTAVWSIAADSSSNIYVVLSGPRTGEQSYSRSFSSGGGLRWEKSSLGGNFLPTAVTCTQNDTVVVLYGVVGSTPSVLSGYTIDGDQIWTTTIEVSSPLNSLSRNKNSSLVAMADWFTGTGLVVDPADGRTIWSATITSTDYVSGCDFDDDGNLYFSVDFYPTSGPVVTRVEKYVPVVDNHGEITSYTLETTFGSLLTDAGGDGYQQGGTFYSPVDSSGLIFSNNLLVMAHTDSSFHQQEDSDGFLREWVEHAYSVHAFRLDVDDNGNSILSPAWSKDWGVRTGGEFDVRQPNWSWITALGS